MSIRSAASCPQPRQRQLRTARRADGRAPGSGDVTGAIMRWSGARRATSADEREHGRRTTASDRAEGDGQRQIARDHVGRRRTAGPSAARSARPARPPAARPLPERLGGLRQQRLALGLGEAHRTASSCSGGGCSPSSDATMTCAWLAGGARRTSASSPPLISSSWRGLGPLKSWSTRKRPPWALSWRHAAGDDDSRRRRLGDERLRHHARARDDGAREREPAGRHEPASSSATSPRRTRRAIGEPPSAARDRITMLPPLSIRRPTATSGSRVSCRHPKVVHELLPKAAFADRRRRDEDVRVPRASTW